MLNYYYELKKKKGILLMNKKKGIDLSTINADDTPILRKRQKKRLVEEKKEEHSSTASPIDTLQNIKTNNEEIELGKAGEVVEPDDDVIIEMFEEPNTSNITPEEPEPEEEAEGVPEYDPEYILVDDIEDTPLENPTETTKEKPKKDGLLKQLKQEYKELSKGFKIISILLLILSVVILGIGLFFYNKTSKQPQPQEQAAPQVEQKQEQPKEEDNTSEKDKLQNKLEESVKSVNTPTKVTTEELFGGYILGSTTYYPDDPQKLYIDFTIKAPKEKQPQADDETALKILKTLKSTLPKINDTIEVKDKSKVTMEIYKQKSEYQTILLYDGVPFAYVSTDKDLVSTNHVTGEYISKVAKDA
jgi:hypothetical protein